MQMAKTSCKCKQVRGQKNRNALLRTDAASCKCNNEATTTSQVGSTECQACYSHRYSPCIHSTNHYAFAIFTFVLRCLFTSFLFFFCFLFICFYSPHTTVHTVTTIRQVSHFVYIFSLLVSQYEFQFWFLSHAARHMQLCNRSKRVCSTN